MKETRGRILSKDSMVVRLLLLVGMVILLTTGLLTVAGNIIYTDALQEQAYQSTDEIQRQVQETMDERLLSISHVLEMIGTDEIVQQYLAVDAPTEPQRRLYLETAVRNRLLEYSETYPEYLNLVLVSEKGQYLSNDSYRIARTPLSMEDWYQTAKLADGRMQVFGSDPGRNLESWRNYSVDSYLSVAQLIKHKQSGEALGVILMDWDLTGVREMMKNITLGKTGVVFVLDAKGQPLYQSDHPLVYRVRPEWFGETAVKSCVIDGKVYNLLYQRSKVSGLTTVGLFDADKAIVSVVRMRYLSVLLGSLTLVIGIGGAIALSVSVTRPLRKLSGLMKKVKKGDFSVRFEENCGGEIAQLGETFNLMIDQTNQLIHMVYQEQQDKREAEIRVLQQQIKPHFLYNTLDTISWMARRRGADDVVKMVYDLSRFFRISLSHGKEYITLQDEITMVSSYLNIQMHRYQGMFTYEVELPKQLQSCMVSKLLIQPLVENAIYHGIKEADREDGLIRICVRETVQPLTDEAAIEIEVSDNGAGMSDEKCRWLNEILQMENRPDDLSLYGTRNVFDRIRLTDGEGYGVFFRVQEGGGTVATVTIKQRRKEDKHVEDIDR